MLKVVLNAYFIYFLLCMFSSLFSMFKFKKKWIEIFFIIIIFLLNYETSLEQLLTSFLGSQKNLKNSYSVYFLVLFLYVIKFNVKIIYFKIYELSVWILIHHNVEKYNLRSEHLKTTFFIRQCILHHLLQT
jgi:hypothetical protein